MADSELEEMVERERALKSCIRLLTMDVDTILIKFTTPSGKAFVKSEGLDETMMDLISTLVDAKKLTPVEEKPKEDV